MEANDSAEEVNNSDLSIAKCAVFAQVCCISRKSGKYITLGQIQHAEAFQVYNMEIKVHFPLITPTQSTISTSKHTVLTVLCT